MFALDDHTKQYPYSLVQRVSSTENKLYSGLLPLVVIMAWALVFRPGFHQAYVTIAGLFISVFLTSLLTDIIKKSVGRPRPDLIARCKPRSGTPEHIFVTIQVCTEPDYYILSDGWRSFPSGHSSYAFSGLGYFALFLAGQFRIFRPGADLARVLIVLAPLIGALLVAISRLANYSHDIYDITAGSILGMTVAWLSYRRYYRPLKHTKCEIPYPYPWEFAKARNSNQLRDVERPIEEDSPISEISEDERQSFPSTTSPPTTAGRSQTSWRTL